MNATIDITTVKSRMKATWEAGDYATFATYLEPGATDLLEAWGVEPGQRLLDVGCGAGQLAIPAARMGLEATGVDIARNLVEKARERAAAEGLRASFDEGDAEALPYEGARAALRLDLDEVFTRFDRGTNGNTFLEGEFLSVEVVR